MNFRKLDHQWLSVIVSLIVGVVTVVVLLIIQEPVYATDGTIRFENAFDPHMFIIYIALAITVSIALVDFIYWLIGWCQKQNVMMWCQK